MKNLIGKLSLCYSVQFDVIVSMCARIEVVVRKENVSLTKRIAINVGLVDLLNASKSV